MKLTLIFIFIIAYTNFADCVPVPEKKEKKDDNKVTIWDEMSALTHLPGDMTRKDFIAVIRDGCIMIRLMPLPWPLPTLVVWLSKIMEFMHPVYWKIFPKTRP